MNYRASLVASLLVVTGCGGGGSPSAPAVITPPTTVPPVTTSCTGNHLINVITATDEGMSGAGNGPDMAMDDDLSSASRWETTGDSITITFDLGWRHLVREVGIA